MKCILLLFTACMLFLVGFFQFRITPKVKLYLRKGVASCCHFSCKSSVTDLSGSCRVLYWFPKCFHRDYG